MLKTHPIALFCSVKCPGKIIMKTYDLCLKWRKEGKTVISGFHSPMEKECLRILLKGPQPVIISPARGIWKRIPKEIQPHIESGRLLIISQFPGAVMRVTAKSALERNRFIGGLADKIFVSYADPGGKMEKLCAEWLSLGKTVISFSGAYNSNLLERGVKTSRN